jgi:hypothetical protein
VLFRKCSKLKGREITPSYKVLKEFPQKILVNTKG